MLITPGTWKPGLMICPTVVFSSFACHSWLVTLLLQLSKQEPWPEEVDLMHLRSTWGQWDCAPLSRAKLLKWCSASSGETSLQGHWWDHYLGSSLRCNNCIFMFHQFSFKLLYVIVSAVGLKCCTLLCTPIQHSHYDTTSFHKQFWSSRSSSPAPPILLATLFHLHFFCSLVKLTIVTPGNAKM